MNWLIDNWYLIVALAAIICVVIAGAVCFFKLPTNKKIESLKKTLRYLVTEAERELGSKVGQLKLAKVYQIAVSQYPWLATFISYEQFDSWVKEALVWMEKQMEINPSFKAYVEGKE